MFIDSSKYAKRFCLEPVQGGQAFVYKRNRWFLLNNSNETVKQAVLTTINSCTCYLAQALSVMTNEVFACG